MCVAHTAARPVMGHLRCLRRSPRCSCAEMIRTKNSHCFTIPHKNRNSCTQRNIGWPAGRNTSSSFAGTTVAQVVSCSKPTFLNPLTLEPSRHDEERSRLDKMVPPAPKAKKSYKYFLLVNANRIQGEHRFFGSGGLLMEQEALKNTVKGSFQFHAVVRQS